ncbi:integrase core domain-containing protein [Candidatus Uabimicrobium amorphum]|uniref:integrase core domain-containing protein n=1 Tax=Uabimicrobium amorphum TaxID=2596890 RepID=UPI0034A27FAB
MSNDNYYIESRFKTLKYCPSFPETFGCVLNARAFCQEFFNLYNNQHYHSGIGLLHL